MKTSNFGTHSIAAATTTLITRNRNENDIQTWLVARLCNYKLLLQSIIQMKYI